MIQARLPQTIPPMTEENIREADRLLWLGKTLAAKVHGQPHTGAILPADGSYMVRAVVPSSRVPENLIHMLEAARRGLDDEGLDTTDAEMSVCHHLGGTRKATVEVILKPQTGEK